MSELVFHRCNICKAIFYGFNRISYCRKCIPPAKMGHSPTQRAKAVYDTLSDDALARKREMERKRWHARMSNPAFRERERLRSLARARKENKYAVRKEK